MCGSVIYHGPKPSLLLSSNLHETSSESIIITNFTISTRGTTHSRTEELQITSKDNRKIIMTRASGSATRVHYEGSSCNFVIFGTSQEMVSKWKKDHSLPLAEVVDSYHVFTTYVYSLFALYSSSGWLWYP